MKEEKEKPEEKKEDEEIKCQEFPKHKWGKPFGIMYHREKKIRNM